MTRPITRRANAKSWVAGVCVLASAAALLRVRLQTPPASPVAQAQPIVQAQSATQVQPAAQVKGVSATYVASLSPAPSRPLPSPNPRARFVPSADTFRMAEVRGMWLHTSAPFNWDGAMQKLADAHFNCVFVRAARGINAIYPSQFLAQDPWSVGAGDELRRAVEAAHRHGLKFHAWVVCFNANEASTSQGANVRAFAAQMRRADRMVRDANGKQGPHLNPADPRNQALVANVCREIVQNYPVDGIHLDYIRYPDAPTYDYDYGSVSRGRFEAFLERKVAAWPAQVFSGSLKRQYEDWERAQITGIVCQVRRITGSARPLPGRSRVLLSAALWRQWRRNRATIKQDWVNWTRAGLLDFAVPMNYKTSDEVFRQSVHEEVAQVGGQVPLVAGIGNWQLKAAQLLRQIAIARQEGTDGYCLFAYNTASLNAQLAALQAGPQRLAAPFDPAPRLSWSVQGGIERPDDAPVFVTGSRLDVGAAYLRGDDEAGIPYAQFDSVALQNMATGAVRPIGLSGSEELMTYMGFNMPYGRWRIVARGTVANDITPHNGAPNNGAQNNNAKLRPFVAHGPILEGVTPLFAQRLAARKLPPIVPRRSGKRVGVFTDGLGASGILAMLSNASGVNAFPLYHLESAHLVKAQTVIVPHPNDVAILTPQVETALRAWVSQGGHLILTHDAVGFRWDARLFPEVGAGARLAQNVPLSVEPNSGLTPGALTPTYPDHVVIEPAAAAQVLVREAVGGTHGDPVVVRGRLGRGTVILMGTLPGYVPLGKAPSVSENQLLRELLKSL